VAFTWLVGVAYTTTENGNWIVALHAKPKMRQTRDAMIWALGRLGQRVPVYGPLNSIVPPSDVGSWIAALINLRGCTSLEHLCVVQMARMTGDRYRDIDEPLRKQVIAWLTTEKASEHYVTLVQVGGKFDSEEQTRIFGEALPPGLRLE
jgi:hypothetical protein